MTTYRGNSQGAELIKLSFYENSLSHNCGYTPEIPELSFHGVSVPLSAKGVKQAIRERVLQERLQLSKEYVDRTSQLICNNLTETSLYQNSRSIALYHSFKNEIDTLDILKRSVDLGKSVLFPRMKNGGLVFSRVEDSCELILNNKYGIYEPDSRLPEVKRENIDLFIVPGVAFDVRGNRLGYGKGYYDRTLASVPHGKVVGLCYRFQIFDFIPTDVLDKRVDYILSDGGILGCKH